MCVLCTILAQESSLTCKPAGEGFPVVMCVIMVNFYVLLELSEKLALEARLFPYSYLRPMFVSKSLPRPFCLEMGWQPKVFDRTDKTAQKSKHHVPENSWKVNNFQQMLPLFIPCYKSVCSGEEVWEFSHGRLSHGESSMRSFRLPQLPQSVSAGCKLLNSQRDLCLLAAIYSCTWKLYLWVPCFARNSPWGATPGCLNGVASDHLCWMFVAPNLKMLFFCSSFVCLLWLGILTWKAALSCLRLSPATVMKRLLQSIFARCFEHTIWWYFPICLSTIHPSVACYSFFFIFTLYT